MQNTKKRIEWVDYLKAFACFLVVLGHLLQSFQHANIDNYTNITTFINWFIYLFHMPLFMMMSGFLYCKTKREFTLENYKKFALKKIINLAIPYIIFYLIFVGINMVFSKNVNTPRGVEDILKIFNDPISPYWFLYALLSIFIAIPILEKILKNNRKYVFGILIILKLISVIFKTNIYFVDSIMAHGIYFYLGEFIPEEDKNKKNSLKIVFFIVYLIISLGYYCVKDNLKIYVQDYINIIFALMGIYVCVYIFKNINSSKILDSFKSYTFQIYLLHTIFAAGARIVLMKLGITNYFIHFIIGGLTSIYLPVMVSVISERTKYTNFFFYPIKTIGDLKEK